MQPQRLNMNKVYQRILIVGVVLAVLLISPSMNCPKAVGTPILFTHSHLLI